MNETNLFAAIVGIGTIRTKPFPAYRRSSALPDLVRESGNAGDGARNHKDRARMLLEESAHDLVDVGVEVDLDARLEERGEAVLVARGADMAPAVEDVRFLEALLGMAFAHDDAAAPRPIGQAPRRERGGEAQVVHLRRLLADAGAAAAPHLPREAGPAALLPAELAPAEAVLRGDSLEHVLHVALGRERPVERRALVAARGLRALCPVDVLREQHLGRLGEARQPHEACV